MADVDSVLTDAKATAYNIIDTLKKDGVTYEEVEASKPLGKIEADLRQLLKDGYDNTKEVILTILRTIEKFRGSITTGVIGALLGTRLRMT